MMPKTAMSYIKKIIKFYGDASFIGRPKLSSMKLEKSVSGTKEQQTLHDPDFNKWQGYKKSITHDLKKIVDKIDRFGSEEVSRSPRKRCKSTDHPKGKKKTFGIEYDFCPYCKGKLYEQRSFWIKTN